MKKNLLFFAVATCMGLFSSCTQDEVISESQKENQYVTVSAALPESYINTRALTDIPNHKLRFILEVQKQDGSLVSSAHRIVKTQETTNGNIQFTFEKPSESDCKCVVWADYVDNGSETDKYYNTASLNSIQLTDGNTVYNNPAVDAFCGSKLIGSSSTLSITLKRPFAKYTVKDTDVSLLSKVTALGITATVPDNFNISTGKVTSTKTVNYNGTEAASATELLYGYYFIDVTTANNALPQLAVTFTVDGNTGTANLTPVESNANSNYSYSSTNDILSNTGGTTDMTLDVEIDSDFTDPSAPADPQIGDYLFADGTWGANASQGTPVAIVFAVGAGAGDNVANYDGKLSKINGYAVGLIDATTTGVQWCNAAKAALTNISESLTDYLGYSNTAAMSTSVNPKGKDKNDVEIDLTFRAAGSLDTYATSAPATSSGWYIPSAKQLEDLYAANISNSNYTAPLTDKLYWSSTIDKANNSTLNLQSYTISFADGSVTVKKSNVSTDSFVRPVVTF